MSDRPRADFRLGEWIVDPSLNRARRGRRMSRLTPRAMDLLCALAEQAPRAATREELIGTVWQGSCVGDESLTHAISELRKALGDDSRKPRYVETIPKRGYRLLVEPDRVPPSARAASGRTRSLRAGLALVLAAGAVASVAPVLSRRVGSPVGERPAPMAVSPLTSRPGPETEPALSPDGEWLAFAWRDDIYVSPVASGAATALTSGPAVDAAPAWSPDGERVAFARHDGGRCGIWIRPLDGAIERRVGACGTHSTPALSWHPSGGWLAVSDTRESLGGYRIRLLSLSSRQTRPVSIATDAARDDHNEVYPAFSPDGRRLAWARSRLGRAEVRVVRVGETLPVAESAAEVLMAVEAEVRGLDWTADGRAVVVATGMGEESQLWRVDLARRAPVRLDLGSRSASQPSVARNGRRFAFVEQQRRLNLWEAVVAADRSEPARRPLASSTRIDFNPSLSPDGTVLTFASTRSGDTQIWTSPTDGTRPRRLTHGDWELAATPTWSPDGTRIAFSARRDGSFDVLTVAPDGGAPRVLLDGPADDADPAYSADGRLLYFASNRSGRFEIWRVPSRGGHPEQVTTAGAIAPNPGPGGRYLYHARKDEPGIWRRDLVSGKTRRITDLLEPQDWNNWAVVQDAIYLTRRGEKGRAVLVLWDLEHDRPRHELAPTGPIGSDLEGGVTGVAEATQDRVIYAQRDLDESDLYLAEELD